MTEICFIIYVVFKRDRKCEGFNQAWEGAKWQNFLGMVINPGILQTSRNFWLNDFSGRTLFLGVGLLRDVLPQLISPKKPKFKGCKALTSPVFGVGVEIMSCFFDETNKLNRVWRKGARETSGCESMKRACAKQFIYLTRFLLWDMAPSNFVDNNQCRCFDIPRRVVQNVGIVTSDWEATLLSYAVQ